MKNLTIIFFCLLILLSNTRSGLPKPIGSATKSFSYAASIPRTLDHGGKIDMKYDGFNYETVVTLKKMRVTCGAAKGLQSTLHDTCVSFVASLHCPGVQLDYVRYAKLQLIFESKSWDRGHAHDERELIVVADGESLKLGTMALSKQSIETSQLIDVMREALELSLPYETFSKIARADVVEMKVGKTIFALQQKNIDALRDLNNRVKISKR
jgi:hypothetical protein